MSSRSTLRATLDSIFTAHMDAELAGNLDETLATMAPNPHLVNVPTMIGGQGSDGVRTFYAKRLIGQFFPPEIEGQNAASLPVAGLRDGSTSGRPVTGSRLLKTFWKT